MPKKSQTNSRSIGCQTMFREQSAQTKLYLPPIRCHANVEQTELFQIQCILNTDSSLNINDIKKIGRRQKRLECERILEQCDSPTIERKQIFETLEWNEWLCRETDIEQMQSIRFRIMQDMLKKRNKLFEIDLMRTIDQSLNCFTNEHQLKIENKK